MRTVVFTNANTPEASLVQAYSLALTSGGPQVGGDDSHKSEQEPEGNTACRIVSTTATATVSYADPRVTNWLKFSALVSQWHLERGATSSITEIAACPAYHRIMGMGEEAIPLIIDQLKKEGDEPDQWFWALNVITGDNPVKAEDRGDFVKMAAAWISWAQRKGYAW